MPPADTTRPRTRARRSVPAVAARALGSAPHDAPAVPPAMPSDRTARSACRPAPRRPEPGAVGEGLAEAPLPVQQHGGQRHAHDRDVCGEMPTAQRRDQQRRDARVDGGDQHADAVRARQVGDLDQRQAACLRVCRQRPRVLDQPVGARELDRQPAAGQQQRTGASRKPATSSAMLRSRAKRRGAAGPSPPTSMALGWAGAPRPLRARRRSAAWRCRRRRRRRPFRGAARRRSPRRGPRPGR